MATHSSVLAWRIPGTGEPGGLPSMGSHRVGHDWSDLAVAAAAAVRFFVYWCGRQYSISQYLHFLSVPVNETGQYLIPFTWKKNNSGRVTPQDFTESPHSAQIPKADPDVTNFPRSYSVATCRFASLLLFLSLPSGRQHPLTKAFSHKGT